jgi:Uri superfamily endonuclease
LLDILAAKLRCIPVSDQGVSDLLCMSNLFHASPKKEHDENDIIKRAIGSIAEGR